MSPSSFPSNNLSFPYVYTMIISILYFNPLLTLSVHLKIVKKGVFWMGSMWSVDWRIAQVLWGPCCSLSVFNIHIYDIFEFSICIHLLKTERISRYEDCVITLFECTMYNQTQLSSYYEKHLAMWQIRQ